MPVLDSLTPLVHLMCTATSWITVIGECIQSSRCSPLILNFPVYPSLHANVVHHFLKHQCHPLLRVINDIE